MPVIGVARTRTIMGHVEICHVLMAGGADTKSDVPPSSSADADAEAIVPFRMTDRLVAVKVNYSGRIEHFQGRHAEDPLMEVAAMQLIGNDCPHVMGLIDVLLDEGNLNVVMPYGGSDLFKLLVRRGRLEEGMARRMFRQIIYGIQFLHNQGVCHRDLSPENILCKDEGDLCTIIDMGMAIRVPYTDPNTGEVTDILNGTNKRLITFQRVCGKDPYMSPEIYQRMPSFDGEAIDVWTAGIILYCMVTGVGSYKRADLSDQVFLWMAFCLRDRLQTWNITLSDECIDLLERVIEVNPRDRLTLDEIVQHPWFLHTE